mgnify:CR=1 FL=1
MNQRMSDYLFEMDKETLKDTNRTNHITKCHRRRSDAREGLVALLIAAAFMALYVGAQSWTKAGIEERFTPTQEANRQAVQGER